MSHFEVFHIDRQIPQNFTAGHFNVLKSLAPSGLHQCRTGGLNLAIWKWPEMETGLSWSYHISKTGWWLTYPSEKWWTSSVGMIIPNIWKNKKCSKPPIRIYINKYIYIYIYCNYNYIYLIVVFPIWHKWKCPVSTFPYISGKPNE